MYRGRERPRSCPNTGCGHLTETVGRYILREPHVRAADPVGSFSPRTSFPGRSAPFTHISKFPEFADSGGPDPAGGLHVRSQRLRMRRQEQVAQRWSGASSLLDHGTGVGHNLG